MKFLIFGFTLLAALQLFAGEQIRFHKQDDFAFVERCLPEGSCKKNEFNQSRKFSFNLLNSHLVNAYRLETWYYRNDAENKIVTGAKNKNLKNIAQVISARFKMQKEKLDDFVILFCSTDFKKEDCTSPAVKRIKTIKSLITESAYHKELIDEANSLIEAKFAEVLNRPGNLNLTNPRGLSFRVLNSYFSDQPALVFVKIDGRSPFRIQSAKITQKQWVDVLGYNPSFFSEKLFCKDSFQNTGVVKMCPDHPVESFSFRQLQDFMRKLSEFDVDNRYSLPSGKQWVQAAALNYDALSDPDEYAWYYENSGLQTHAASKKPGLIGLYDMLGNLFELVQPEESEILKDPAKFKMILHGANWYSHKKTLSILNAWPIFSDYTPFDMGARLIQSPRKSNTQQN